MIKTLAPETKTFVANGSNYIVLKSIPLARYVLIREAGIKIIEGVDSIYDLIAGIKTAYELVNKMKFADSAVKLHNLMNGLNEVSMQQLPAAYVIAACMIAKEGEDLSDCSEKMIADKIEDWSKEGYDAEGFFHFALSVIPGLSTLLKQNFLPTSSPISEQVPTASKNTPQR